MADPEAPQPRAIPSRRPLPNGRAVVGGLLVALAGVGALSVAGTDGGGPTDRFFVAARPLRAGHVLTADDVRPVSGSLPPSASRHVVAAATAVDGMHVVSPVEPGALLSADAIRSGPPGGAVVTLALPRSAAVGGALRAGDRVDAYVSFGTGTSSSTRLVASATPVVEVGVTSSALGESGDVDVTLEVTDRATRIDLVNATHAGMVTLARTGPGAAPPVAGREEVHTEQPAGSGKADP